MSKDIIDFVEAEEDLLIDFQFLVQDVLNSKGISKTELARRAGISKARLSQILSAEANPCVKTFARLFHALGVKIVPKVASHQAEAFVAPQHKSEGQWEIGRVSRQARTPDRKFARANDWLGACNDNNLSVEWNERSLTLEAA